MRRLLAALVSLLGCGGTPPVATPHGAAWPELCPGEHREHSFSHASEDPDCWRAHFPVRTCESPAHPELVGLWGLGAETFEGRLLYDGCCVTFHDTGLLRMHTTLGVAAELATYGREANVGNANRTVAEWDGDTLRADSHFGRVAVGGRAGDGSGARFVFIDHLGGQRTERELVRFEPPRCVDEPTRDLLCARLLVPGGVTTPEEAGCPQ